MRRRTSIFAEHLLRRVGFRIPDSGCQLRRRSIAAEHLLRRAGFPNPDSGRRPRRRSIFIETRLAGLGRRKLTNDLGALAAVLAASLLLGTAAIAGMYWSGWLLVLAAVPAVLLAVRWLPEDRLDSVAREVEQRFEAVRNELVAARQLAGHDPSGREQYSTELLQAAVARVEQALAPLPLGRLVRTRRLAVAGASLVAAAALLLGVRAALPVRFTVGLVNAFAPSRLMVGFAVLPGDTTVLPGAGVRLRCRVHPSGAVTAVHLVRTGADAGRRVLRLDHDTCAATVRAGDGFRYHFSALSARSAEHRVRVMQPVSLRRLVFTLHPPKYTGLAESRTTVPDIGSVRGTRVEFAGEAAQVLAGGRLVLAGETLGLSIDAADSTRFSGEFTVAADGLGSIDLAGADDGVEQPAVAVRVRALADEPPFVKLFLPGRDVDLPVSMQVPLGINAIDDYGLGEMELHYGKDSVTEVLRIDAPASRSASGTRIRESGPAEQELRGSRREDTVFYNWDLSRSDLLPGEEMRYYVSVRDNDAVAGPKTGRTETYAVRFPTMTELYSAAVRQTERTASELGPMQSEQEQLGAELSRLSDEMRRNRELTWDEKQALEKTLGSQSDLLRQVQDLHEEVSQLMDELNQGLALDEETMNRLGQLQELLSQMLPRELQQSLAQLSEKLQHQAPDVKRALEKFALDQEQLRQGIERALDLLKRIAEEQRLEELARKADELAQAQQELTDRLGQEPSERSAAMEQEIAAALDSLQKEMKSLADSLSDKEIADSLGALGDQAEQQQLTETAQSLQSQMRQGRAGQSKPQSQKLAGNMQSLAQSLSSLSRRLKEKRSQDVARRLTAAAADVLLISGEQERLGEARPKDMAEAVPSQMSLREATRVAAESLVALSGQSLSVPPGLDRELGRAMKSMQDAGQALFENRAGPARQNMTAARQSLNRVAQALLESANEAREGGLAGGMENLAQQLAEMASEQMGINAGMGGMPIPIPGGMSPGLMEALGRILAKQQALRGQLEQLMQSMGGTQPGLTSSLDGVLEEMRAVEQDLASQNVTRELIERQESILSHLLDAQRSVRQQGFKEKRESESGRPFEVQVRPRLPEDKGERNRLLREELMRALKQGYPAEYEEMIRRYFERLLSE